MAGQRQITGCNVPLAGADSVFELTSGELTVTVTDPTGQRTTTPIAVDIQTDSLQDVVDRLNAVNGLNASLATNGTVALHANTDFSFDFAGLTDQQPIVQSVTGTAAPAISGTFLGSSNSTCQAEIITGGEVGVSADVVVVVRVTDTATGNVIGDFNFGLGYAAN